MSYNSHLLEYSRGHLSFIRKKVLPWFFLLIDLILLPFYQELINTFLSASLAAGKVTKYLLLSPESREGRKTDGEFFWYVLWRRQEGTVLPQACSTGGRKRCSARLGIHGGPGLTGDGARSSPRAASSTGTACRQVERWGTASTTSRWKAGTRPASTAQMSSQLRLSPSWGPQERTHRKPLTAARLQRSHCWPGDPWHSGKACL